MEPIPDVQSLALRANSLTESVDGWNNWMVGALVFTSLAAIAVVVTTRVALVKAKQLAEVQSQLLAAKDSQLALDLRAKDEKIEEAKANANEAMQRAESERLERVKLEALIAPRSLSIEQQRQLSTKLSRFAGDKVVVASLAESGEPLWIAEQLINSLTTSGIVVVDMRGGYSSISGFSFGIHLGGSNRDLIKLLETELRADGQEVSSDTTWAKGILTTPDMRPIEGAAAAIFVGTKPIPKRK